MYKTKFVAQDPAVGLSSKVFEAVHEISSTSDFNSLKASVAYATTTGCKLLSSAVGAIPWEDCEKRWLISIDFGLTQPEALTYLQALPNSLVRVPNGLAMLKDGFHPKIRFHPKTYIFDYQDSGDESAFAVFTGSANLTGGGLISNVEHCTSLVWGPPYGNEDANSRDVTRASLEWWDRAWDLADEIDNNFIKQYRAIRPKPSVVDDPPIVTQLAESGEKEVTFPEGLGWSQARCFWIETHELYKCLGPDRSGNQLDCRRGTRVYFGFPPKTVEKNTVLGQITLKYKNMPSCRKSVRFANNMMDKVNLPIPVKEGPYSYDDSHLHFERTEPGFYKVVLGSQRAIKTWRRKSKAQGMHYHFTGGREYGFYS
ncbi:hypothetical protein ACFL3I_02130 [Pseudomonadota bacterium]